MNLYPFLLPYLSNALLLSVIPLVGRYVPIGRVQTSIRSNAVPVSEKRGLESGVVIGIRWRFIPSPC